VGPGFDTLALALDRYVLVDVEPASKLIVRSVGEGAGLADDSSHLAARVAIDVAGTDHLAITVRSDIPIARGLGSSAALAVAAAAAAGAADPLSVATAMDGHPDNAAASMVGGFVVKGGVHVVRLPLDVSLAFVVIVPDVQLSTAKARQALPTEVSRESASFNLSRMALLMAGMADCRLLIPEAAEDRLHQDYRSPLFPAAPKLLAALVAGGALASCWSGAGPSLLGICRGIDAPKVQTAGEQALVDAGLPGQVLLLHADMNGLMIDRDGSGGLYDREL
jgi:homoserine kinase